MVLEGGQIVPKTFNDYSPGFYLFSEASWPRQPGDKARLASGFISGLSAGDTSCRLRFYFHMFGSDIGSLNVYTRPCNGCVETLVFSRSGNVGNYWDRAEAVLKSTVPFQVRKTSTLLTDLNRRRGVKILVFCG